MSMVAQWKIALSLGGVLWLAAAPAQAGATFEQVKARGAVNCGVNTGGVPGFSAPDKQGVWQGLDVETCRALGAALFGDIGKVKLTPLSGQQRFTALQSGEVDVLIRQTTITLMRDVSLGLRGAGVNFYDGQGFVVPKKLGVKSAKELGGASICVQQGSTTELNLADFARANKITTRPLVMDGADVLAASFFGGRCDAYTSDLSQVAAVRTTAPNPDDYIILPDRISKEPLGPMVRRDDNEWLDVVRWSLFAMIAAEELGITRGNVDDMLASANPEIQRVLGVTPQFGKALGLSEKWAYNIVKQVGNYGEVYDRTVGKDSPLKLERGLNALWTQGGLMYALPMR
jgi:general L-amino acid transport system substrate-binding protein